MQILYTCISKQEQIDKKTCTKKTCISSTQAMPPHPSAPGSHLGDSDAVHGQAFASPRCRGSATVWGSSRSSFLIRLESFFPPKTLRRCYTTGRGLAVLTGDAQSASVHAEATSDRQCCGRYSCSKHLGCPHQLEADWECNITITGRDTLQKGFCPPCVLAFRPQSRPSWQPGSGEEGTTHPQTGLSSQGH